MSDAEIIDRLVDIAIKQANIIRELHSAVRQLDAVTSLSKSIEALQNDFSHIQNNMKGNI